MKEINNLFKKYSKIKIYHHINPDGDTLGSQYGLYYLLKQNFPRVIVELITYQSKEYDWFTYQPKQVEDYKDDKDFLAIMVDAPAPQLIAGSSWENAKEILVIDHHAMRNNKPWLEGLKQSLVLNDTLPATTLVILDYANKLEWKINKEAYHYLALGLITDTLDRADIALKNDKSKSLYKQITLNVDLAPIEAKVLTKNKDDILKYNLILEKLVFEKKFNYVVLTIEDWKKAVPSYQNIYRELEYISKYEAPHISLLICEFEKDLYKVELRSILDYKVNKIASNFKGGGHKNAAGCTIKKEEIPLLLEQVRKEANHG